MRFMIAIEVECDLTDDVYGGPRTERTPGEVEVELRRRYESASSGRFGDVLVGLTVDRVTDPA